MPTPLSQIFHVYNRLGFGITYPQARELASKPLHEIINAIIVTSSVGTYLNVVTKEELAKVKEIVREGNHKEELDKLSKQKLVQLNLEWMKQLVNTQNVLLEKQTLFWHNHFACRVGHPLYMQELNNIHRKFAFANFRDLLVEVCKSPAMLIYLNNQQNRKEHPNENFARELMELFTLGRGNYTEQDVKEAARAFTGWGFDKESGQFAFREKMHDEGEKSFFTKKGNLGGEDIINMIMSNKQTAYFLTRKMYKYYVNEKVNEAHVKELAEFYYMNQYNTGALVKKMFSSLFFYDPVNIGCNIKSPVEFLVGLLRKFEVKVNKYEFLFKLQEMLGQKLFFHPNVAGWPGGREYIDSSTLIARMRLPSVILSDVKQQGFKTKKEIDMVEEKEEEVSEALTEMNWEKIITDHQDLEFENLQRAFLSKLPLPAVTDKLKSATALSRKEMILKIVSLPEFNLN